MINRHRSFSPNSLTKHQGESNSNRNPELQLNQKDEGEDNGSNALLPALVPAMALGQHNLSSCCRHQSGPPKLLCLLIKVHVFLGEIRGV